MKKIVLGIFLAIGLVGYSQQIQIGTGEIYKNENQNISVKKTSSGVVMFTFKDQHEEDATIYFYKEKEAVHFFEKINQLIEVPDSAGDITLSFSQTHIHRKGVNDGTILIKHKYSRAAIDDYVIGEILTSLEG